MYKVIKGFHDLTDFEETKSGTVYHWYAPGDTYPRRGKRVTDNRIQELASEANAQCVPLITEVKKKPAAKKEE